VARPRFLKFDPERRDRLLEAAAEEFAARGYGAASLNKLIARLGLSKGQFYSRDTLTPDQRESLATFGLEAIRRMLEPPAGSPGGR
jgi:hypothetical protein